MGDIPGCLKVSKPTPPSEDCHARGSQFSQQKESGRPAVSLCGFLPSKHFSQGSRSAQLGNLEFVPASK